MRTYPPAINTRGYAVDVAPVRACKLDKELPVREFYIERP
jgi:hypothetical protein